MGEEDSASTRLKAMAEEAAERKARDVVQGETQKFRKETVEAACAAAEERASAVAREETKRGINGEAEHTARRIVEDYHLGRKMEIMGLHPGDPFVRSVLSEIAERGVRRHDGSPITEVPMTITEYPPDSETKPTIERNVRGQTVNIIVRPGKEGHSVNHWSGVLEQIVFALSYTSKVGGINVFYTEFSYARQDKTHGNREPLSAKLQIRKLECAARGTDLQLVALQLHSEQIQGFPEQRQMEYIKPEQVWADLVMKRFGKDAVKVKYDEEKDIYIAEAMIETFSPDPGGVRRDDEFSKCIKLKIPDRERYEDKLYFKSGRKIPLDQDYIHPKAGDITKLRDRKSVGEVETGEFYSLLDGKTCFVYDDLTGSGGTGFKASKLLKEAGAEEVVFIVTHAPTYDKPEEDPFDVKLMESGMEMWTTDSRWDICQKVAESPELQERVTVLSMAKCMAEAIVRIKRGGTLREMMREFRDEGRVSDLYEVLTPERLVDLYGKKE